MDNHSSIGNPEAPHKYCLTVSHGVCNHNSDFKHGKSGISAPPAFQPLVIAMSHMLSTVPSEARGQSIRYLFTYYILYSMAYPTVSLSYMGTGWGALAWNSC